MRPLVREPNTTADRGSSSLILRGLGYLPRTGEAESFAFVGAGWDLCSKGRSHWYKVEKTIENRSGRQQSTHGHPGWHFRRLPSIGTFGRERLAPAPALATFPNKSMLGPTHQASASLNFTSLTSFAIHADRKTPSSNCCEVQVDCDSGLSGFLTLRIPKLQLAMGSMTQHRSSAI